MILRDEYVKNLTEYGWIATYIPYYQEKWMKRGMINTRHPLNEYNWNNHCLCDWHSNAAANTIAEEETRGKKKRKIQRGLKHFFTKISDKKPK